MALFVLLTLSGIGLDGSSPAQRDLNEDDEPPADA
jgi:hypothetical protein